MVRVDCPPALNGYLLRIRFRQWAKLWSLATLRLHDTLHARAIEQRDHWIGSVICSFPMPSRLRKAATRGRYGLKRRAVLREAAEQDLPTSFLLECYNPGQHAVPLSLTLRPWAQEPSVPFQALLSIEPGFKRLRVPMSEILAVLDARKPFEIELIPGHAESLTTLYFGLIDFVREASTATRTRPVKCVVWDLDNTLWNGILVEDGMEGISLKPGVSDVIRKLDERGILQSIASKNDSDDAMQALRHFGLEQYFLYPEISWLPKSQGVRAIAQQLNIGLDSLLFIDDSSFELDEVQSVCAGVRTLNARQFRTLADLPECQGDVTSEGRERRLLYQVEAQRRNRALSFGDDYFAFLRDAKIRLEVRPMTEDSLDRAHELTQRTNQMNFSGNRYSRDVLCRILADPALDGYLLSCEDRFGSYGVIGLCIVDRRIPRMKDLMFSCRIQSKRVEHAFLTFLLRRYRAQEDRDFLVSYRRTSKNAASGRVFSDFSMEELETVDGVSSLLFRAGREIPDDHLATVIEADSSARGGRP
jgi:FkbH-like protein